MEELSKKGVTFEEMYPGVFIVTSINGNQILQDVRKINRVIRLYHYDLINESDLVCQISEEKIDEFFQRYVWTEIEKERMQLINFEYRKGISDTVPSSLLVTYKDSKTGRELTYGFRDDTIDFFGFHDVRARMDDLWDKFLFDETVKSWSSRNNNRVSNEEEQDEINPEERTQARAKVQSEKAERLEETFGEQVRINDDGEEPNDK